MRMSQCFTVLKYFKSHVFKKYGFIDYRDDHKPVVFWGCYPASRGRLINHKGFAVVIWRGSDSMVALKNPSFVKWLQQNSNRIKHIAISNFIEQDLTKCNIPFVSLPITSMDFTHCNVTQRGTMLYAYSPDNDGALIKYHTEWVKEIATKSGLELKLAHKDSFSRNVLINHVYRDCFLGLRLLEHDGCPNTGVELGLCGRRIVHNGNLPNSINYTDTKSILQIVAHEYAHRKDGNGQIAKDIEKFINIDNQWLNTDYYANI